MPEADPPRLRKPWAHASSGPADRGLQTAWADLLLAEVPVCGAACDPMVELVEVIHVGTGRSAVSRRRAWSNGRLVSGDSVGSVDVDRIADDETILVETCFGSEEDEARYWDPASGAVLADSVIRWRGTSEPVSCGRFMLDEFAPSEELPGATFFVRFVCRGLALDPGAGFEVDLRLLNGRPVDVHEEVSEISAEPEFVVSGNADEIFTWCAGAWLPELDSLRFERGDVFLLASVAGVLSMAGGFAIPANWVTAVGILVGLVDSHRRLLEDGGPPA